jgi:GTP-binding protein
MDAERGRPRVAIVGAPNVGKSTLFNRLVRSRRALVADHPGLTRDLIEASASLGEIPVTLVDTGGLLPPGGLSLAQEIRRRVLEAASDADLLLFVVDGRHGILPLDEELALLFRRAGRPLVLLINKVDRVEPDPALAGEFASLGFERMIPISAEHDLGIADVHLACAELLPRPTEGAGETEAIEVAIAGRPNVGKSSLLNALLRRDRSLVSEMPGTTRDTVDAELTWEGKLYRLVDTAGLRRPGRIERGPESLSVGAAHRALEHAALTVVVLDGSEGLVAQDMSLLGIVAGGRSTWVRPAVVLVNKIDLIGAPGKVDLIVNDVRERLRFARFVPVVPISALTGRGLDAVLPAVERVLVDSTRLISTNDLNNWLRAATVAHPHPAPAAKPLSFVFITQSGTGPPKFTILMNQKVKPHFSYARYLENSLREKFDLRATPVVMRFRHRPGRRAGRPNRPGGGRSSANSSRRN